MPKILFTTSTFNLDNFAERDLVKAAGYELIINPYGKRLTEEQLMELIDDEVIAIVAGLEPITSSVLMSTKNLKVIARCGVGLDNVNIECAKSKNISVYNTPDSPTRSVAELTLAHILSLSRRISEANNHIKNNQWNPLMGSMIAKQTIGIIGFGRIGMLVGHLLTIFGCRIIVYDPMIKNIAEGYELVSFDEIIKESDVITLHIPYKADTHHLIGTKQFDKMKKGTLLVNIARGGLVDEQALFTALNEGKIGGAALDCFENEPYNGPLTSCKNIQMTAHMGSYAKEGREMQEAEACVELMKGLRKHNLI
jgi:D-3-phosphoglycerate dehydrogenase